MAEWTVGQALREAAGRLEAISGSARLDAELLMAEALGVARSELLLRRTDDAVPAGFDTLVERRLDHEPVVYILGRTEFYGREFRVQSGVLIPRADSETLIGAALAACPAPGRVLDLGVGSGALLVTVLAECPGASGIGIDRDPLAIDVARDNARHHAAGSQGTMRLGDWHQPNWAEDLGRFDLIMANPPYVEDGATLEREVRDWEPPGALFAGVEGLDDYAILLPQMPELLEPGGALVLEIGASQAEAVTRIAAAAGFAASLHRDLAGRPRALVLRLGLGKAGGSG